VLSDTGADERSLAIAPERQMCVVLCLLKSMYMHSAPTTSQSLRSADSFIHLLFCGLSQLEYAAPNDACTPVHGLRACSVSDSLVIGMFMLETKNRSGSRC